MLKYYNIVFGCDPEFFFSKKGQIVGAEKILPEKGLEYKGEAGAGSVADTSKKSKFIIDGIQAELNPRPNNCRANLANEISACFKKLNLEIKGKVDCNFSQAVDIEKKEMESLSEKSKVFGCKPSYNIHQKWYKKKNTIQIKDASKHYNRSAGGHIHLSASSSSMSAPPEAIFKQPERLIPILDIVLGNTCVLIDRDKGNLIRRKLYGRAGEYRKTNFKGIEYRTLSNFWLKSYPLFSLVMSLARYAVIIVANDADNLFRKKVDMKNIEKAINNNDYKLAVENFKGIEDLICEITPIYGDQFPLHAGNIDKFWIFVNNGIDHYFKNDPLKHWINLAEAHGGGWEEFLTLKVR